MSPFDYRASFLSPHDATSVLCALTAEVAWESHRIRIFGREVDSPRRSCWVGDPDAVYSYSGTRFAPHAWTPTLLGLRQRVGEACGAAFNSVLCNLYRDGRDYMGWHSDDERELGGEPIIASLSFGAPRRFVFRLKRDHSIKHAMVLEHGSLLVMRGTTQRDWQHALPRTARPVDRRINLTFRRIFPELRRLPPDPPHRGEP